MPLEGNYVIWNNRGGSGKTTIVYHLANKYACKHPDKTILLVDMCPQADLSHAFLGDDDSTGLDYVSQIGTLRKDPLIINDKKYPKTVSGYLDLSTSIGLPTNIDPRTFLLNVSKYNSQIPHNLYLLCGDASIELLGRSLDLKRHTNSWKSISLSVRNFIKRVAERKGIRLVTFVDTNSTFSIATELALCAADRLIIPTSDDQLHRNAFEYIFALLYGYSQPSHVYYYYRHLSFYSRAHENDVQLPKIHLILNKSSSNTNHLPTWQFVYDTYLRHPEAFHPISSENIKTLDDFIHEFVINIDLLDYSSQETCSIIKQAVKIHSPLLSIRNSKFNSSTNSTPFHTPSKTNSRKHTSNHSNSLVNGNTNDFSTSISATSSATTTMSALQYDKLLNEICEKL